MKKVGLILPSEIKRLAPHKGALESWYDFEQRGLLPRPYLLVGNSAGAIAAAACVPWNKPNFQKIDSIIAHLERGQIFSVPKSIKAQGVFTASTTLLNLTETSRATLPARLFMRSAMAGLTLGAGALFVNNFLKGKSLFSNEPLKRLLTQLDFQGIFESDIKLEILTTDIKTGREVVFTNFLTKDRYDNLRLLKAVAASSSLLGRFPLEEIDNYVLTDAAVGNALPIERAIEHGCDVVIVLHYNRLSEQKDRAPSSWIETLSRGCQITEDKVKKLTLENLRLRQSLGYKLPEIYVVESRQKIPEIGLLRFSQEALRRGIDIGYESIVDRLSEIRHLVI